MNEVFQEVHVDKVSDKIVNQIRTLIIEGKLQPGDKLPGERRLIDMLSVGRSSLREALNTLQTLGYIEIRKRRGNYVKSITASFQMDPLKSFIQEDRKKIVQMYDLRSDIEKSSAYEAALNKTERDIDDIRRSNERFSKNENGICCSWDRDRSFHNAIASASKNYFRVHVLLDIFDFSREFMEEIIADYMTNPEYAASTVQQHDVLIQAIIDGDADAARDAMDDHLTWTKIKMNEYFSALEQKRQADRENQNVDVS